MRFELTVKLIDVYTVKHTCLEIESLISLSSVSVSQTRVQSLVIFGHVYDVQVKHHYFSTKHAFVSIDLTFVIRYSFTVSQPDTSLRVEHAAFQHNTSLKDSFLPIASYLHISNLDFFGCMSCGIKIVLSVHMNTY